MLVNKELLTGTVPVNNLYLIFNTFTVKEKVFYKFLGDLLHTECLSASVQATVKEREGKIKQAMMEICAIIQDFGMQALRSMQPWTCRTTR